LQHFRAVFDEFREAELVRVGGVERPENTLLQFVMEILAVDEFFLGRAGASDEHAFKFRVLEKLVVRRLSNAFVELVDGDEPEPLKTALRLSALRVFSRNA
jgi:hypothetical protein